MSTGSTLIQYSIRSPSNIIQTREGNQKYSNRKRGSQTIFIWRYDKIEDMITYIENPKESRKAPRNNKAIQQNGQLQNQYTKGNDIFI